MAGLPGFVLILNWFRFGRESRTPQPKVHGCADTIPTNELLRLHEGEWYHLNLALSGSPKGELQVPKSQGPNQRRFAAATLFFAWLTVTPLLVVPEAAAQVSGGTMTAVGGAGVISGKITGITSTAPPVTCEVVAINHSSPGRNHRLATLTLAPAGATFEGSFEGRATSDEGPNTEPLPAGRYRVGAECVDAAHTGWSNNVGGFLVDVSNPDVPNDGDNLPPGELPGSRWWDWPDGDGDGLPDHWEQSGVWVGGTRLDLAAAGASPARKDLFIYVDHEAGYQFDPAVVSRVQQAFANSPLNVAVHFLQGRSISSAVAARVGWVSSGGSYRALENPNFALAAETSGSASSPWSGGGDVPQLAKYFLSLDYRPTSEKVIGTAYVAGPSSAGTAGWVAYNPPVLWRETAAGYVPANLEAVQFSQASNLMHEIGHTLGLHHYGDHACANWADGVNADERQCQDGSRAYRSVMSYAYNVTGIQSSPPGGPSRIDYSTTRTPHYDWKMGSGAGQLRFIPGQFGELAGRDYSAQGLFDSGDVSGQAEATSFIDLTTSIIPTEFDAYMRSFGLADRPNFPEFIAPKVTYRSSGKPVSGQLPLSSSGMSPMTLTVEIPPGHGTFTVERTSFTYAPEPGYRGEDTVVVRGSDGTLSSEPLTLTFTTATTGPTTPTQPPGPGGWGSSDWGSS